MQEVDLLPIKNGGAYAVHCATKGDAIAFTNAMKKMHPERTKNWAIKEDNWDVYCENTVYYPHFELTHGQMMYGRLGNVKSSYSIIPFSELVRIYDLPIVQSDVSIDSLLGL